MIIIVLFDGSFHFESYPYVMYAPFIIIIIIIIIIMNVMYVLFDTWSNLMVWIGEMKCRIVKEVVEGPAHNLLESVAQLIASTTFTKHPQISAVRVVVGKPHVAVPGSVDYLGVEILRYRSVDASN